MCEFTQDCNHLYDGEKQWFEFTQHKAIQVISKKGGQDVNVCIHTRFQGIISKCRRNVFGGDLQILQLIEKIMRSRNIELLLYSV